VADVAPLEVQLKVELPPALIVNGEAVNDPIAGGLPTATVGLNKAAKQT
jgi:hypothetical protein